MADPSTITPPYLDPSQYPAYLDMQRKQMLASMLMQGTQQADQTPSDWNSMRLVPRRSALQNLLGVAGGYASGKALGSAQQSQNQYFQGMFGGGQQPPPAAGAAAPDANASALTSSVPYATPQSQGPGPQAPPPGGTAPQGAPPQAPMGGGGGMIPAGMGRGQASQLLSMMGPEKYAEQFIAPSFKPAEIKAQIRAAGIDPDSQQGRMIAIAALRKATYTAPIEQRAGSIERDPYDNHVIGQNPSQPVGGVNLYDEKGNLTGSAMSPGATEAIAASTGAATAGKVANEYNVIPNAGGGSSVVGGPHTGIPGMPQSPGAPQGPRAPVAPPQPGAGPAAPQGAPPDPMTALAASHKLQVPTGLGGPDEFTKGMLQEAGKKHATLASEYGGQSDIADQKLQYNSEALGALPDAEIGPMSGWLTEHRRDLAEVWGIPERYIPGGSTITPTYILNKNLLNSALQGAKQVYGPRMTSNEVMLQKDQASPSVETSRGAIQSLITQDNAKNEYLKQRAVDYQSYRKAGGDPMQFESSYAKTNPLQKFAQAYAAAHPIQAPAAAGPAKIASDDDYAKLPSGTEFIGPDGKRRKKP